jgi:hypothetical protein
MCTNQPTQISFVLVTALTPLLNVLCGCKCVTHILLPQRFVKRGGVLWAQHCRPSCAAAAALLAATNSADCSFSSLSSTCVSVRSWNYPPLCTLVRIQRLSVSFGDPGSAVGLQNGIAI